LDGSYSSFMFLELEEDPQAPRHSQEFHPV